jgi:ABC-type multidrug transport system ATPase subunit
MNESTLNALINLFAVFSIKGETDYQTAEKNLEEYLSNHLGIRNSAEYIALFFEIYDLYDSGVLSLTEENTREITGKICNQIKSRIHHADQLMIFLHFLELARRDFNSIEHEIYDYVADIFEIQPEDYKAFKKFIFCDNPGEIDSGGFLVINQEQVSQSENLLHLFKPSPHGEILFLYVSETGQFIFKYFGHDSLMLEGGSIRRKQFYVLNHGGIIRGNQNNNIYYTEIAAAYFHLQSSDPLVFTCKDVSYTFPNSRNGIHNFSFSEKSGQLIAVMGGSGVGKSTLLNVLNGSLPLNTGSITINGIDIHTGFAKIEGLIGYIPQDDLVFEELTVFQNIWYNALLCLNNIPPEHLIQQIDKLLTDLGLFEVRDMVVGNPLKKVLSGGQRKRLNIALELVREPSILFVDEPTSGLSSRDSEKIMVLLKQLAQQGKLIIVNIHQPSSFIYKLFDKLWIFDKGGYPIYAGNPLDAITYFKKLDRHIDAEDCECSVCGNVNPEQVLEIIENLKLDGSGRLTPERKYKPDELHNLYLEEIQNRIPIPIAVDEVIPGSKFAKPGILKQFRIFLSRNVSTKLSNAQYIIINLLQAPLLALVVSFLTRYSTESGYYFGLNKNFPSFIFMSIIVMLFQGMSLSAEEIIRDRKILQREAFLRLSRLSYLNSKIVFLFSLSLAQSLLFTLISSWVLGMEGLFLKYWLILFLTAAFANMAGLNISSGLNSVVTIYITIPLLIIPQILLCGLIVKFDDLKSVHARNNAVPVIGDIMVSRWSFEALAVEQYVANKYNVAFYDIEKEMSGYFIRGELMIPKLSNLIGTVSFDKQMKADKHPDERTMALISNTIHDLDGDGLIPGFNHYGSLSAESFNRQTGDSAIAHLNNLRSVYKSLYRNAENRKDQITNSLIGSLDKEGLLELKELHHNSSLANIVTNQNIDNSIVQGGDNFLVKVAPIFRLPESRVGRAHFYAPAKKLGNLVIPTYIFNLGVILMMIMALYAALYFDWLRRALHFAGSLKLHLR